MKFWTMVKIAIALWRYRNDPRFSHIVENVQHIWSDIEILYAELKRIKEGG